MRHEWLVLMCLVYSVEPTYAASIDCSHCAAWNADQAPFRIYGNTYYVGTRGLSSVLVASPQGHVLIDGGLPQSAPLIAQHIQQLGFSIKDVKLILNSHAHFDHAGGLAELQRMSGASVIAADDAAPVLRTGRLQPNDPQFEIPLSYPGVANVEMLGHRKTVDLGPLRLTLIPTPGHTPGGSSWTWRSCEGERCLDIVYADSLTAVSDDSFRYSGDPRYPTAAADLLGSIDAISRTSCDILITPHPDAAGLWSVIDERGDGERAKLIDPSACKRYAAIAKTRLEKRLQRETTR